MEDEKTIRKVIDYLAITETPEPVPEPAFEKLADDVSEEWVERFRRDLQKDWKKIIW